MSQNQGLFKNKIFLITLSFLLVFVLAAGIFGMEYSSVVSDNNSKESKINALESELNDLSSKNAENESKISNQQKERDDLIDNAARTAIRKFLNEHYGKKPLVEIHLVRI